MGGNMLEVASITVAASRPPVVALLRQGLLIRRGGKGRQVVGLVGMVVVRWRLRTRRVQGSLWDVIIASVQYATTTTVAALFALVVLVSKSNNQRVIVLRYFRDHLILKGEKVHI